LGTQLIVLATDVPAAVTIKTFGATLREKRLNKMQEL